MCKATENPAIEACGRELCRSFILLYEWREGEDIPRELREILIRHFGDKDGTPTCDLAEDVWALSRSPSIFDRVGHLHRSAADAVAAFPSAKSRGDLTLRHYVVREVR